MNRTHTLYRFWNGDQLLYVGITSDPGRRWRQHHKSKLWWGDVTAATLEHFPTRAELEAAEVAAIHAERPLHNVMHNRGHVTPARRPITQVEASDMPDMCHDRCADRDGIFFPYRWINGTAHYQCDRGHTWRCGWGHDATGRAPECRRVNQTALARIEQARAGARIPARIESTRQGRHGVITGTIADCPFCGQRHTHGLGTDPDRLNLGPRSAHCRDVFATYHLELADPRGDLQPLTTRGVTR